MDEQVFYTVQERLAGRFWRDIAGPFSTPEAAAGVIVRVQAAEIGTGPWRLLRCENIGGAS